MNAIDKLRAYAPPELAHAHGELNAIADEIEAAYMELPVDAWGEPIHDGDRVRDVSAFGHKWDVLAVARDYWVSVEGCTHKPGQFVHVEPRTLEDVLRDVWNEALDYAKSDMWRSPDEVFSERAAEIRGILGVVE